MSTAREEGEKGERETARARARRGRGTRSALCLRAAAEGFGEWFQGGTRGQRRGLRYPVGIEAARRL
jgi:hypothetical protein